MNRHRPMCHNYRPNLVWSMSMSMYIIIMCVYRPICVYCLLFSLIYGYDLQTLEIG